MDKAPIFVGMSTPEGQVRVGWEIEEGVRGLRMRWEERGGPRVVPPAARGFGTRLIEYAAMETFGGPAELTFASKGLQAEIAFPLD
jgi:two-component sensor histidine kinase